MSGLGRVLRRGVPHLVLLAAVVTGTGAAEIPLRTDRVIAAGGTCVGAGAGSDGVGTAELNQLFAGQVDEYIGLDALRAYPLPDGRVLWLFQDAFFAPTGAGPSDLGQAHFVHNAALIQEGGCFRAIHGPTSPGDRCPNPGRASYVGGEQTLNCHRWFWPMGGAMGADGTLHVFYALVGNARGTGANTGASPDGVWIARIDPVSLSVVGLTPAPDDDGKVMYGWSVEDSGDHTYLFGHSYDQFNLPDPTSPRPNRTFLARVPSGRFDLMPEYWDGSGWTNARADAAPVNVGPDQQPYAMQPRLIDGVWVSVTKPGDWFGTDVVIDSAPAPEGPWTRVRAMALPTKTLDGSTNTYQPHLLPWRSALGNLIVTVSHNAWAMNPVAFVRPWLYRPTFFEVEPPESMPATTLGATTPALGFVESAPRRALDTRTGPSVRAGQVRRVALAGLVHDDALAVAVDVVGVDPHTAGFVTAWSCDDGRPWASNLNLAAGSTQAAFALVRVSSAHEICLYSSTDVHLVVDVFGSYVPSSVSTASSFRSVGPVRLLDTRRAGGIVQQGRPRRIWVEPGTTAVSINVAATEATDAGYVTAYPCDQPVPATSNLNVAAGQTLSNHAQVGVSPQGELCIVTSMTTHLVVDLVGAFSRENDGWWYRATTPTRLVDSREGIGVPVGPITRAMPGAIAVPADSRPALTAVPDQARALVLTAVAVDPRADGWLTVSPCRDDSAYDTVALNTTAGRTTANLTVVPTRSASGRDLCVFSMMAAHQVLDLAGWFAPA
jgi:hypothetical protein